MAAELNLGMKCIKYMLLTVNMMFVLTATLIISVGTTIYAIHHDFKYFLADGYLSPASLLIAIGLIMLAVSIFGCCGAVKESTCMVNIFALFLTLVFILEIAAAIAAYSLQGGLVDLINGNMRVAFKNYEKDEEVKYAIDFLQSRLSCCGIDQKSDWANIYDNTTYINNPPDSCCAVYGVDLLTCTSYYENGCMRRLAILISQSSVLLGTGAITIAFIQFLGIIFAIMLGKAIRHAKSERERRRWEIREQIANAYTQMEPHQTKVSNNPNPNVYVPVIGDTKT